MDRFIILENIGNMLGNLKDLQNLAFPIISTYNMAEAKNNFSTYKLCFRHLHMKLPGKIP